MSHGGFAAGTGAAHTFDAMTGGGHCAHSHDDGSDGGHAHPHGHPDLDEIVDDHADHLNTHADRLDEHDGRLTALEASGSGHDGNS